MKSINEFVNAYDLQVADVVIVKKKNWRIFDHTVVYMGIHDGQHWFAANMTDGIRLIPPEEAIEFLIKYEPEEIVHFQGSYEDRQDAFTRALFAIENMNGFYGLVSNNCQHFANWVQHGIRYSQQVDDFSTGTMVSGGIMALLGLIFEDKSLIIGGLSVLAGGAVMKSFAHRPLKEEELYALEDFHTLYLNTNDAYGSYGVSFG